MTQPFVRLHPRKRPSSLGRQLLFWCLTILATVGLSIFGGLIGGAQAGDLRVVTTIKPIHALAKQVLDGIATPKLLIEGAASPHVYALKPSDAEAVHHADLFVRVAPSIEPFTEKIISALPKTVSVLTLIDAKGLELLKFRDTGAYEAHGHGDAHDEDHNDHHGHHEDHHDDEEDHADDHGHHHSASDPHIWLDPENAADIVQALVKELQRIAPQHKVRLEHNGSAALAHLSELEQALAAKLAPVKKARFIVFHDAFQYFEKRFGLQGVGAITLHPEAPPSGKRLTEIRAKIKTSGARCVFSEPQFNAKRIATVIEGTNARTGVLDPLGYDARPGGDAYSTMMHKLADGFVACLKD